MLQTKIVYLKKIYKFCYDHFLKKIHGFYFNQKNVVKNKKLWFPAKQFFDKTQGFCFNREKCY